MIFRSIYVIYLLYFIDGLFSGLFHLTSSLQWACTIWSSLLRLYTKGGQWFLFFNIYQNMKKSQSPSSGRLTAVGLPVHTLQFGVSAIIVLRTSTRILLVAHLDYLKVPCEIHWPGAQHLQYPLVPQLHQQSIWWNCCSMASNNNPTPTEKYTSWSSLHFTIVALGQKGMGWM